MKILTIDTSTAVASAAVTEEDKLIGEIIINHRKKHAEQLLPAIDHLLNDVGLSIQDMDGFGVVKGPGSFTGLRIGIATVKGFAQAMNKPVVGVSTLEALAANLPYADGILCPMLDARRGQVFTGLYAFQNGIIEVLKADGIVDVNDLIQELKKFGNDHSIYLLGEGVNLYGNIITEALPNAHKVAPYLSQNRASSAGWLVHQKFLKGETEDVFSLEPFYLRPSYAEE